jgi:hypothetical protein
MSEDVQAKPVKTTPLMRRVIIYAALLLGVFLLGFVPMWLQSRECSTNLSEAERQLSLARIQNTLASAAIDARRGDYEPARHAASNFFTSLRTETDRGDGSALSQAEREGVQPLFARRDEFITLLARSDAASADRLFDLYVSYRKIMDGWGGSLVFCGIVNRSPQHQKVNNMKLTKNLGMLLLGIWLVVTGLLQVVTITIPAIGTILALLAIAAGVSILLGR